MKRTEWVAQYPTEDVIAAAERKVGHHGARVAHWRAELESAQADLGERGVEFREDLGGYYASTSTAAAGPVVAMIPADIQKRLAQADQKVREHQGLERDYRRYAALVRRFVTAAQQEFGEGKVTIGLDINDVEYFDLREEA